MNPSFGLPQSTLDEMRAIFARHNKVTKVVVYGSRAKGNYRNGSDIDLTMFGKNLTFQDLSTIHNALDDSSNPYLVNLSIYDHLDNAKLREHIDRVGQVFYYRYEGWKKVKLGDVCSINNGGTPNSKEKSYWGDEVEWLTPKDMGKLKGRNVSKTERQITKKGLANSSAKLVPENSVIISCRAPIGHVAINDVPMSFNQGCKGLIPNEKITTEFLYYFLVLSKKLLNELGTGTTFKEISAKTLSNVSINVPPLAEQQRIVAKLDAAFAEIDKAIVLAESKVYEIANLRGSLLFKSLSENAVMWETLKLGDLFKIGSSKRVLKADWRDNGVPFYRGREITALSKDGYVDNDLFISETHFAELSSKYGVPQTGDILVTAIGTIGNTYIVNQNDRFYFKDASVLWLKRKSDVDSKFVDYWFKSAIFTQQLEVGNGATVDTLSISKLNDMEFVLPSLAEQQRIVAKLDAIFAEIDKAKNTIKKQQENYKALKSAILAQQLQSEAA